MYNAIASNLAQQEPIVLRPSAYSPSGACTPPVLISREKVTGRFSLIDRDPIYLETVPGMTLYVHSGRARAQQLDDPRGEEITAGTSFVAEHHGVLAVKAHAGVELQVKWPATANNTLSA